MRRKWNAFFAVVMAGMMISGNAVASEGLIASAGGENEIAISEQEHAQGDVIALDDLGISVQLSSYTAVAEKDGYVYIYTGADGSIPYVIIGVYDTDAADFADQFTEYMRGEYPDLQVTEAAGAMTIKDRSFVKTIYSYEVSGYQVQDTRLFCAMNGKTYMFGAKEIPELSWYASEALAEAAESFWYLAGGDSDYAQHVDANRSAGKGASQTVDGMTQAAQDTIDQNGAGTEGTIGSADGTVGSIAGSAGVQDALNGSITFDEASAPYAGTWVPFQDGFRLYLPSDWTVYELSDEETQQGVLYLAGDASGAKNAPAISVVWAYSQGTDTLEELADAIRQSGYTVDDLVEINGIGCITYRLESEDCSAVMFFHPTDPQYVFCVTGAAYSENVDTICAALTSLSRCEA